MKVRVIRTMRKTFLQILSNWSSCHWVLLSLILLSSGLQSIPSSPSFQSRYPAVCNNNNNNNIYIIIIIIIYNNNNNNILKIM